MARRQRRRGREAAAASGVGLLRITGSRHDRAVTGVGGAAAVATLRGRSAPSSAGTAPSLRAGEPGRQPQLPRVPEVSPISSPHPHPGARADHAPPRGLRTGDALPASLSRAGAGLRTPATNRAGNSHHALDSLHTAVHFRNKLRSRRSGATKVDFLAHAATAVARRFRSENPCRWSAAPRTGAVAPKCRPPPVWGECRHLTYTGDADLCTSAGPTGVVIMPSQWGRVSSPKLAPPRFRSSLPAIDRDVGKNPVTRGSVRADQRDRRGEQRPIPELPELRLSRVSWNLSGGPPPDTDRGVGVGRRQDANQEGDHRDQQVPENHAQDEYQARARHTRCCNNRDGRDRRGHARGPARPRRRRRPASDGLIDGGRRGRGVRAPRQTRP